MNRKRFASMFLAGAMAAAMAVPTFAATNKADSATQTVDVAGSVATPTIALTVAGTGKVILNPYKMTYTVKTTGTGDQAKAETSDASVVFDPIIITNKTNAKLNVNATITGKPSSTVTLVAPTETTKDGTTTVVLPEVSTYEAPKENAKAAAMYNTKKAKQALMWFEAKALAAEDVEVTAEEKDDKGKVTTPASVALKDSVEWGEKYDAKDNQVIVSSKAVTKDKVMTLAAALDNDGQEEANYAAFTLLGETTAAPATAWAATDKVDVTVALTFVPVAAAEAANGGD